MARRWSVPLVLALLACLLGRGIEAQYNAKGKNTRIPQTPKNPRQNLWLPTKPQNPSNPLNLADPPSHWQYIFPPNSQNPLVSSNTQPSSVSVYPQNPLISGSSVVRKPQQPTKPQTPQQPTKPQSPQHPPRPQSPQHPPRPQSPQHPPRPQSPQHPSRPQSPQQPSGSSNSMYVTYGGSQSSPPGNFNPTLSKPPMVPPPVKIVYPQSDQSPKNPQVPQVVRPPVLPQPVTNCEVEDNVRVPCGAPGISSAECEALSCCYDGRQCFFGKAVTVQCTKDGQFIVVVAKDATVPKLNTDSISLQGSGSGCSCVDSNSAFAIFQFPVTACGSLVMEESGVIVYQNSMSSTFEVDTGPHGVITRDTQYELLFQCRYTGESVEVVLEELNRENNPILQGVAGYGPLRVGMRLGNGQCVSKGCNELSVAYSSYYTDADYPIPIVLRDPVYVEVLILDQKNPDYVLTLDRCWATNCADAYSLPQWDILINGCPNVADNYRATLVPVPTSVDLSSHYRRFVFQMFAFVENNTKHLKQEVYIHCTTAVCVPTLNRSCEPVCMARKRRDASQVEEQMIGPKTVVSSGPLLVSAPAEE